MRESDDATASVTLSIANWQAVQRLIQDGCRQRGDAWRDWGTQIVEHIQSRLDEPGDSPPSPNKRLAATTDEQQRWREDSRTPYQSEEETESQEVPGWYSHSRQPETAEEAYQRWLETADPWELGEADDWEWDPYS